MDKFENITLFYENGKCKWVLMDINGDRHISADTHNVNEKAVCVFSYNTARVDPLLLMCLDKANYEKREGLVIDLKRDNYLHITFKNDYYI